MTQPTSRVLALLELLQSRTHVPGSELAQRLGVAPRTVRRYIEQLVALGLPIQAQRGCDGGYALAAGHKLPPMMFNADEALALTMGLQAARALGLNGIVPAISSSQAKLERVLPDRVRQRVAGLHEVVALDLKTPSHRTSSPELLALSAAARAQQRVRLDYLDLHGHATTRPVDVYGLAYRGGAWYAVGHCHLRADVRSFRLDRVQAVEALPVSFGRPEGFDVLGYLTHAIATLPRQHEVRVTLHTELATARRALYAEIGLLEPCAKGVRLLAQVDDLDEMARQLAALPFGFTITKPSALRQALRSHAQRLLAQAG